MSSHFLERSPGVFVDDEGTHFLVWAPEARAMEIQYSAPGKLLRRLPLTSVGDGYHGAAIPDAVADTRYRYFVDGTGPWPDPCSRYQPDGPHGESQVVDPRSYRWQDSHWRGVDLCGQVIYELHIGAFTTEGTFDAAIARFPALKDLGVTVLEVMPVGEFPGRFNWGYDGVQLFAPFHGYGDPHSMRRFVDAAHRIGLAVILDVVYNHLGPDGNYLTRFSPHYFTDRYGNEWGEALDFDGPESHGVRSFFIENARYWIRDFHLDGLRLDATQSIHDSSPRHVLAEITAAAREAAGGRRIVITAENEPQHTRDLSPIEAGGFGLDAMWNDDFHHTARVAATGSHDGYFHDYRGTAQEFISAAKRGFLFQGQRYQWQKQPRGMPVDQQPAASFVVFLQNHDQVANTFYGQRLHELTSAGRLRALTALLLLGPQTPLLFMGQEFSASARFPFFADHVPGLKEKVHEGRRDFVAQFPRYATTAARDRILDPSKAETFASARLDWGERERNAAILQLHRDLLTLRRDDPVISRQERFGLDGAVLTDRCFVLRWFGTSAGAAANDRLLFVNLGLQSDLSVFPEPLLAPQVDCDWAVAWSSDDPAYGGPGVAPVFENGQWYAPPEQATLFVCAPREGSHSAR